MKAKRSILGLILVIGMLLSCVGASYAAAAAPKFTTTKLADGTHGQAGDWEIKATGISDGGSITVAESVRTVLEVTYGLTVVNDEETGALTLTAEELGTPTPSAGYKFKVTATNVEGTKVDKEYTLKILAVAPSKFEPDPATNADISSLAGGEEADYPLKGEPITDIEITVLSASPTVVVTATGLPTGLKIEADGDNPKEGGPANSTFKITGTPKASGKFNITITAANAKSTLTSGKGTAKYVLNVLEAPGLNPASAKDVTYGKEFTQKFTVTGLPKGILLSSGDVAICADEEGATDISGEASGISGTFDPDKGVFTVTGTPRYNEFGTANSETVYLLFSMTSPASSTPTEVKMPLKIQAVAPTFTNKTEVQEATSKLKLGEAIGEGGIPVKVDGPGTITFTVDTKTPLPAGLEGATATDETGLTTYTITGTPEVTAKNYTVNLTAANAKGSSKLALKFTIDADPPTITANVDESYAEWAVGSGDMEIILEADRPVTWKATNLPRGLTLELESVDKNAKLSQWATIKGNPTAAMKEDKFISVTATDPDLKKTSEPLVLAVFVHSKPTIKTTKLSDIKIGAPYSATVKATDATEWSVIEGTFAELEGINFDSSDPTSLAISGTITETPVGEDGKPTATAKLKLQVSGSGGDSDPVEIEVKIKGDTPKFSTSSFSNTYTKAGEENNEIVVKGAMPMDVKAYITVKDAKSAGITVTKDIEIGEGADGAEADYTGFYYTIASGDNADELLVKLTKKAETGGSFKKLGVTFEASNAFSGKNGTTKTFKADMTGEAPKWTIAGTVGDTTYEADTEISEELEKTLKEGLNFTAGDAEQVDLTFTVNGDAPLTVTVSPNKDTNGLTIKHDEANNTVTVKSTKDTTSKSTKLTLTVKNGEGSKKINVTLNGQDKPKIKEPADGYKKEVEQGKKFSLGLSLESGTKPIKWGIDDEGGEGAISATDLEETYGIKLDEAKGKLEGTPEHATVTDEGEYEPVVVYVYAENAAGSNDAVPVTIGVTGSKPKLANDSKSITLTTNEAVGDEPIQLKAEDIDAGELVWKVEEKGKQKTLNDYVNGLELAEDGTITGTPTAAAKNVSVPLVISHYGNEQKASVKISVFDQQPAFPEDEEYTIDLHVEVDEKGKTTDAVTAAINVPLAEETFATGASKITWKAGKPDESVVTVKLENPTPSDTHYNTVKITATIAKGKNMSSYMEDDEVKGFTTTFTLTATNSGRTTEKSAEQEITIKVNGGSGTDAASPEDKTIGETKELEDDVVTDDELTTELGEGELTIGTERTVGMLTAGQAKVLDEGRFVIAAILPEISATADGQYGLEVDLAENVKPGAKLYWFAFPKDAPNSEDDTIIDFFEVDGTDTEVVPEDRVVVAYPWFRAGVTYGPVIAVKAEDAESGDAVTEGELEGAAETKAAE